MTSNITVIHADETRYETADSQMNYNGTHAPYGYAGFIVGDCTVLCPECHDLEADSTESPIFGSEESDFPGFWCHDCERTLSTYVLVYESGPGSEVYEEYTNE
jgi:hypothetical protein